MKVFGDIELVQSNIDFYITLSSINGVYLDNPNIISNYNRLSSGLPAKHGDRKASYDELKDYYIQQSLNKYRTNLENSLSSKSKDIEYVSGKSIEEYVDKGCFIDDIDIGITEADEVVKNNSEEVKTTASASDFLSFVNSQKNLIQQEDKSESNSERDFLGSVNSQKSFVPEGFYLDSVSEFINNQNNEFVENGLFIDTLVDVGSEKFEENSNLFVDQGVFIDDCELEENNESPIVEEGIYDEDFEEQFEEEYEDGFTDGSDELAEETNTTEKSDDTNVFEENEIFDEPKDLECTEEKLPIKEIQQVVQEVVPATVREYVKKHPGASYESLCKYYSKKDIKRSQELGRIYKRNNKYYI